MADADSEKQADALNDMTRGDAPPPPPPRSAALFRQARPLQPPQHSPPQPMPQPAPEPELAPPRRPARPDRPAAPSLASVEQPPPTPGGLIPTIDAAALAAQRGLHRKRTLIPILLTCGMLLLATGGGRWLVSEESAFRLLGAGVSIAIASTGGLLIAVAALNMLQVRDQLAAAQRPHPDPV